MHEMLDEKPWKHYPVQEARELGSMAQVVQEVNVSQITVWRGLREVKAGVRYISGERRREKGGMQNRSGERCLPPSRSGALA